MAEYNSKEGYVFGKQINTGFPLTFKMSDKAPAIAKRIFDTLEHAQAYVDDVNDTAVPGLTLSVILDGSNNGLYFVKQIAEGETKGVLERVGGNAKAENVSYDNTTSGLLATDVQSAIDELKTEIKSITGEAGSVQEQINSTIGTLDVTAPEDIEGKYVSKVEQTDGKISVTYTELPSVPTVSAGNGLSEGTTEDGKSLSIKIAESNDNNFNNLLSVDENGLSLSSAIDFGTY